MAVLPTSTACLRVQLSLCTLHPSAVTLPCPAGDKLPFPHSSATLRRSHTSHLHRPHPSHIPHLQGQYGMAADSMIHEIGHTLGLQHASTLTPGGEYGDCSSPMGACAGVRCYNAPELSQLGWNKPIAVLNDTTLPPGVKCGWGLEGVSGFEQVLRWVLNPHCGLRLWVMGAMQRQVG